MADAGFSATTTITVDATKVMPTVVAVAPEIDELNRQNAERAAKDGDIRANFARYKLGLTGKTFE